MRLACLQVEARDWQGAAEAWAEIKKMMVEAAQDHDLLVVPECVYPAYFLAPFEKPDFEESIAEILAEIKEICKKTHTYIAFGYAAEQENLASLFNPQGEEIARKAKSNLWHFDRRWFRPGPEVVTAATEFGKVGLVICADARLPELVRSLALEDVKLVIDLANLTASGPEIAKLSNAQSDYMLATRARENQVWLAVADKWGVEADTVTYAGRSAVYSPDGTCVAQAPADRNMIVSVEIPTDAKGEILCTSPEALPPRRPELYTILTAETTTLPVYHCLTEAVIPERLTPYVIVSGSAAQAQGQPQSQDAGLRHVKRLLEQEPDLIVLPAGSGEEELASYQGLLNDKQFLVTTRLAGGQTLSRLFNNREILADYRTLDSVPQNNALNPANNFPLVTDLPFGRIGFLHEREMLLPEAARCLMLKGADAVIWQHGMSLAKAAPLARTRAAENRIFIFAIYSGVLAGAAAAGDAADAVAVAGVTGAACTAAADAVAGFIVDPAGSIIASTLLGKALHATGAYCNFCNARLKSVVPGTHLILDRNPEHYAKMVQK